MFKSRDMMSNMRFSGLYHKLNREFKRRHESANLEKCIFNWTDKSLKEFSLSCLFSLCTVDTSSAHNWTKIVAAIYSDIKSNGRILYQLHFWLFDATTSYQWVTVLITSGEMGDWLHTLHCFTRQVWWVLSIIRQRFIKSTESPPGQCNISPSDGGDESSDARVDGNMREAATPGPEPVHQTHGGPPWCCVLTVTVVTCDNDNRPGSKLCVSS